jgi:hypothetical protein
MESPVSREFVCYPRNKVLRLLCEDTWIVNLQVPDVAAGSGPPDRTRVFHHRTDKLLA